MSALLGDVSYRLVRVWQRNFTVYRKTWKIGFVPPLLEPLFYLMAFGAGLGALVGTVPYGGQEISYVRFIAPALLAVTMMQNAFFENTYASFVRMYYQKTFDAMLATPLSLEDIISGEIAWGATKAVLASTLMLVVLVPLGLVRMPYGLLVPFVALLGGLAFSCVGMWFTSMMPNIEVFNLPVFLFVTPMFLFSGTFFPLETLPDWAQRVALVFPLTHLVGLIRSLCLGQWSMKMGWAVGYLALFSALFYPLALRGMRRRLVK